MAAVLFVCLGNICRSPSVHAVVAARLLERRLDDVISIDSAATGSWHIGELPHRQARAEGRRRGLSVDHVVRQVTPEDFDRFDLVVAMDHSNRRDLREVARRSGHGIDRIVLLRSFDPHGGDDVELDDPWGKSDAAFREMFDIIERCADPLIDALMATAG